MRNLAKTFLDTKGQQPPSGKAKAGLLSKISEATGMLDRLGFRRRPHRVLVDIGLAGNVELVARILQTQKTVGEMPMVYQNFATGYMFCFRTQDAAKTFLARFGGIAMFRDPGQRPHRSAIPMGAQPA